VSGIDADGAANLFDEPPDQAEPVPLVFGIGVEALAIVADRQGRHVVAAVRAAHRYDGRSLAARESVVIAVGDEFGDDNAQRRHRVEIEDDRVADASQRDGAVRR
jgi:hypothetical protein